MPIITKAFEVSEADALSELRKRIPVNTRKINIGDPVRVYGGVGIVYGFDTEGDPLVVRFDAEGHFQSGYVDEEDLEVFTPRV